MGVIDVLRRFPFLQDIEAPELEAIAVRLPRRRFVKGAVVFHEGDPCEGFWIVLEGSVSVCKISESGREQILRTAGSGGCVGLVSCVDGGPYPATVRVRDDATLILFPRHELLAAMRTQPLVAAAVARTCAARLRGLTAKVAAVALHDVRERVAGFLADEAEAHGTVRPDGTVDLCLGVPQHEIARQLGTAREVYARTLRSLEDSGLLRHARDRFEIPDLKKLRDAAG